MLYLFGPHGDSTTRYFAREARELGAVVTWVDFSEAAEGRWHVDVDGTIELCEGAQRVVVPVGASVYARLILNSYDEDHWPQREANLRLLNALTSWLELSPGRVVNRPGHALDNGSKPLHEAWLSRAGFLVPPSLTSADAAKLRTFAEGHPVVVKTISGIRADCRRVEADELRDFHPDQGPIHLQHLVEGLDIRAHVIGSRVIAVGIRSQGVDYRIAEDAQYFPFELPDELDRRLVEATEEMGLAFAGWDFRLGSADGSFYTLEANPMPGYHLYDRAVNGDITRALLDHLEDPS